MFLSIKGVGDEMTFSSEISGKLAENIVALILAEKQKKRELPQQENCIRSKLK